MGAQKTPSIEMVHIYGKQKINFQLHRPPDKSVYQKIIFLISQPKHMLWGTQKNCLDEMVLMSTQNISLNWWVRK